MASGWKLQCLEVWHYSCNQFEEYSDVISVVIEKIVKIGIPGAVFGSFIHHPQRLLDEFWPESIEWFIEDYAFSPSYDSATPPSHPLLPSESCLSFSVFLCVAGRAYWRKKGVGGGEGAKSCNGEKAWSSINHLFLHSDPCFRTAVGGGGEGQ